MARHTYAGTKNHADCELDEYPESGAREGVLCIAVPDPDQLSYSKIVQAALSPGFSTWRAENRQSMKIAFKILVKQKSCYNDPSLSFNRTSSSDLIMGWYGNQSKTEQKKMSIGLWQSEAGNLQWHIQTLKLHWQQTIGTVSIFQTNVSAYEKPPIPIGHVKITFLLSSVSNERGTDCTLSNCICVLLSGISVMMVYHPAFLLLPVILTVTLNSDISLQTLEQVSQVRQEVQRIQ